MDQHAGDEAKEQHVQEFFDDPTTGLPACSPEDQATLPHSMAYSLLEGGDSRRRFLCCGAIIVHAPQAWYHLWREYGLDPGKAWDTLVGLQTEGMAPLLPEGTAK